MNKLSGGHLGIAALAIAAILLTLNLVGAPERNAGVGDSLELATWQVESRPFNVALTEQVVFHADSVAAISSSLPSNLARVVALAPEGSLVEQGEEIVRFDPNPFVEDLQVATDEIEEVTSQLERARAELEIKSSEVTASIQAAHQRLEIANLSHERLIQVEIPAARQAARDEFLAIEFERAAAQKTHDMTVELYRNGFASGDELNESEAVLARASQSLNSQRSHLELLEDIEFSSMIRESEIDLNQMASEVARLENDSPRQLQIASGSVARFEARIRQLENTAAKASHYIEQSTVTAPVAGIVRYPEISFGDDKRKAQVGDTLWQHQTFLVLPDLDSLVAVAEVREVDVGSLAAGQKVHLVPSAFPDRQMPGEVVSVGTVVDGENRAGGLFEVRISTRHADKRLRPGMTGRASIHTHQYDAVEVIPIEAVQYFNEQPVAYVRDGADWIATPLRLGGSDGALIAVEHGLQHGQTIALSRPPDQSQ